MPIYDVIVIGGGISGLSASVDMTKAKIKVLLLEADKRLGGRIFSQSFRETPIELGAEFIHNKHSCLYNYVCQLNIPQYGVQGTNLYHSQKQGLQELDSSAEQLVKDAFDFFQNEPEDISVGLALKNISEKFSIQDQMRIKSWLEAYHALDVEKASLKFILSEDSNALIKLTNALSLVVANLEESVDKCFIDIKLGHCVSHIDWSGDVIKVVDNHNASFLAKRVLLTIPVSILKGNSITFTPGLPKEKALSCFQMGLAEKIQIVLEKNPFNRNFTFLYAEDELFNYWICTESSEAFVLTAWVAGTRAKRLYGLSKQEIENTAVTSLSRLSQLSQNKLKNIIHQIFHHNWGRHPLSMGAYSYLIPGGIKGPALLAKPVEKKLYFAGEATATNNQTATVHGAFESGQRAAKEILSL